MDLGGGPIEEPLCLKMCLYMYNLEYQREARYQFCVEICSQCLHVELLSGTMIVESLFRCTAAQVVYGQPELVQLEISYEHSLGGISSHLAHLMDLVSERGYPCVEVTESVFP